MSNLLGSIFGFGNKMKRRLRDAVSNPSDYAEMTADENRNEWRKNPDERSLGFFNPVPLGTLGNFTMRKELGDAVANLSRRDFLKKSAGLAGGTAAASIPGAKLLQKFAPEERAVAKQAAVEAAPKYRYNSLKEYLDDVRYGMDDSESEIIQQYLGSKGYGYGGENVGKKVPSSIIREAETEAKQFENKLIKERLLEDEAFYREAKQRKGTFKLELESGPNGPIVYPRDRLLNEHLNAFSPQAKKEMKELKQFTGDSWVDNLTHGNGLWSGTGKYEGTLRILPDAPEAARVNDYFGTGRGDPGYRIWLEAPDGGGPGYKVFNTMDDAATNRSIYMYELLDKFK